MLQQEINYFTEILNDAYYNYKNFGGARWAIKLVAAEYHLNQLLREAEGNASFDAFNKDEEIEGE